MNQPTEQIQPNTEEDEKNESVVDFVPLLNHTGYEILNQYPFTIRKKSDKRIINEYVNNVGYISVCLNRIPYLKHRLIAIQFIPNPNNLPQVDHINHDRTDYHLSNLRWVSLSQNHYNLIMLMIYLMIHLRLKPMQQAENNIH